MARQGLARAVHAFGGEIPRSVGHVECGLSEEWDMDNRSTVDRVTIELQLHAGCVRVYSTNAHTHNSAIIYGAATLRHQQGDPL